jgi:hypothetical protein
MDARMLVTHKEGDRYPLGPPVLGCIQQTTYFSLFGCEKQSRILLYMSHWTSGEVITLSR